MLTAAQEAEFTERGVVRLPGAVSEPDAKYMANRLWRELAEKHGVRQEARETWSLARPSGLQSLARSGTFAKMRSGSLCEALDQLFAARWQEPRHWGQPLVTFPDAGTCWGIPVRDWHLDIPAGTLATRRCGVQVFTYLDSVIFQGGGTLVVVGSHRFIEILIAEEGQSAPRRSAEIRRLLVRRDPWFRALLSKDDFNDGPEDRVESFMTRSVRRRGVDLQVGELTGEPGDVVLMDLRVLHTASRNVQSRARLVLGQQVLGTE